VLNRYRIFATSPKTKDFLSDELEPRVRQDISIKVEMIAMASVGAAALRPAVGQFKVVQADGSQGGSLTPGGAPLRVAAGPVSLRYTPPANDPMLREFTVDVNVTDRYELTGSLYLYCAQAYEKDPNIPAAIRAYTKVLEEKQFPTAEEPERSKLPEKIRALYRGWVDAYEKQGKVLGGDPAAQLEETKKKAPADAIPLLLELYFAKDATPALRGGAAAALAQACAKQGQPYEAMEWAERIAREKVDPGHDPAGAVVAAIKGYPGLAERWGAVAAVIETVRNGGSAKNDPAVPAPGQGGKVGVLNLINKYGIYVKLDPGVQLTKGDVLEVFRAGAIVGEIVVDKTHAPDKTYPDGSAECQKGPGAIQKGDEVRKKK